MTYNGFYVCQVLQDDNEYTCGDKTNGTVWGGFLGWFVFPNDSDLIFGVFYSGPGSVNPSHYIWIDRDGGAPNLFHFRI